MRLPFVSAPSGAAFPNYLEMPARIPLAAWRVIRYVALVALMGIIVALFVRPTTALAVFWGLAVPVLPLVFLIAPGSWRNVCPLAAANQSSRQFGVSKEAMAPAWLRDHGFAFSTFLFISLVLSRKVLLNRSGPATAVVLIVLLASAAAGGYFLKGKSGWCSSICPLLPVQRAYGQSPFIGVANAHCRPCLGCTKNCYDFNPRVSYLADMNDGDPTFRGYRRLFIGAFPGLVLGYFMVPDAGQLPALQVLGRTLLWVAGSLALFFLLDTYGRFQNNTLPPLFGAVAFSAFYWNGSVRVARALTKVFGGTWTWLIDPVRAATIVLAAVWLIRTLLVQRRFIDEVGGPAPVRVDISNVRRAGASGSGPTITFADGPAIEVPSGTSLLEAAERASLSIASGCRMGVCGADPVAVLEGAEFLSPIRREEADTLERLGLGGHNRMACVARATEGCAVSLQPDRNAKSVPAAPAFTPDPTVERVVIVGNGIAGVTVADFLRRAHPDCAIDIVGDEPHLLYNRMAIGRLIHGRQGMQGLYLLPEDWYDNHRVTSWLNTRVSFIDRPAQTVRLGTGEVLPYDRLVIACGGRSTVPAIEGFGLLGTFVLREAADAMKLRQHVQQLDRRIAVVAGGGLLGLEAAHALHQLGLTVIVAERSDRLLRRALDPAGSAVLRAYFEHHGIRIVTNIEVQSVHGEQKLDSVVTTDGETLPCDVLLVAAGVTPNNALAVGAQLEVRRGIVVDNTLQTSDPRVYAVGDVAEYEGQIWGLWPVAVQQARVAATNIAGGHAEYEGDIPVTLLKGVGLDMLSFGRIEDQEGDLVISETAETGHRYRKIIIVDGRIVGGVFLGYSDPSQQAQEWRDQGVILSDETLATLTSGDWSPLDGTKPVPRLVPA